MTLEILRKFCLNKKYTTESLPFDANTLVFKVLNKIYLITDLENFEFFNVKCYPNVAIELREKYSEITPGYHMNKKHWNSIRVDGCLTDEQIMGWIDDSYNIIIESVPKKKREELMRNWDSI